MLFTPIENNSTRVVALLSGEVDIIDSVPLQDMQRINNTPNLRVVENPELRVIFPGFDQKRDVLLNSSVKDKNPFKDRRVRQAFYQAIDIQTIRISIMRNAAFPTGGMVANGIWATPLTWRRDCLLISMRQEGFWERRDILVVLK